MKTFFKILLWLTVTAYLSMTACALMDSGTRTEEQKTSSVLELSPRRILKPMVIQNEPEYIPADVIATEPPEYNVEKFSNPGGISSYSSVFQTTTQSPPAGGLTKSKGVYQGPSGKETWYNLPMAGVVKIMRGHGFTEEQYPYWVRDDGCKMFGDYIMVAANLDLRPRGTVVETSLGPGIVCDTGSFAKKDTTALDIATNW